MSTSSSASSCFSNRQQVTGVLTKCWRGRKLTTYCSQTDENPFRRFYRCEIALQRKTEEHLFKWVDEAMIDETRMVDSKLMTLVDEVKEFRKEMLTMFELQKEEMEKKIKEEINAIKEEMNAIKEEMKEEMEKKIKEEMAREMTRNSMGRIGITLLVIGAVGWICGKFMG